MRRMFGGSGIYRDSVMFGLIASDILYLRTGDGNRAGFERSGMSAFTYRHKNNKGPVTMPYSEVPADILDDPDALAEWSIKALESVKAARQKWQKAEAKGPDAELNLVQNLAHQILGHLHDLNSGSQVMRNGVQAAVCDASSIKASPMELRI